MTSPPPPPRPPGPPRQEYNPYYSRNAPNASPGNFQSYNLSQRPPFGQLPNFPASSPPISRPRPLGGPAFPPNAPQGCPIGVSQPPPPRSRMPPPSPGYNGLPFNAGGGFPPASSPSGLPPGVFLDRGGPPDGSSLLTFPESSGAVAPPPMAPPPYAGGAQAEQTGPVQPPLVGPPPLFPGSAQLLGSYGMAGPQLQQSVTSTLPAVGRSGAPLPVQSKIIMDQVPWIDTSSATIFYETRHGNQAIPPPPATSNYIVRDNGNCSPRLMRCTINQVPCTGDLLKTSGIQLALLVQPLALLHPSEEPIQIVDFRESGPIRCSRCKAYINPFMRFIDWGKQFICNLCGCLNDTPHDYYRNIGPDGSSRDAGRRPELCRGTIEFVASKDYMMCELMPAVYFFLIDVSMNAIQTGATASACSAINQVISDLPDVSRTMVGIGTFDSTIHFYNLKSALQQPSMLIVPEVEDVYTPLNADIVAELSECHQHLEVLLENIPSMFQDNKIAESAFGASIKAAFLAIKGTGGKLLVFQSVLPSLGIGSLSSRQAEGRSDISAGEKEVHKLLQPADQNLKTMAVEIAECQVCVNVFIMTQTYVDVASICVIPRTTGGQVYYYYPFSTICDSATLYNDLRWNVTRPQGDKAVMRVRCSQGIQVEEYSGNFCKRVATDIDLPGVDCDKTIMVTLKHDDKLQDGAECAFQCALLYTTMYGQTRIRVINLSLPCTNMLSNLFCSADLDTLFACTMKQVASRIPSSPLSTLKEQAMSLCINILLTYRKVCATASSPSGQLILPEELKLLPLYILALTKSTGLCADCRADDRSFWISYVSSLSICSSIALVYPRMVAIHDLNMEKEECSIIPPAIPLLNEHLSDTGIYLLENGNDGFIYVGKSVDSVILQQVLGTYSIDVIAGQFALKQYDNPSSKKLNDVVNAVRRQRCSYLRLTLCKQGDPSEKLFLSQMVEDKNANGPSYIDFLLLVNRQIMVKLS